MNNYDGDQLLQWIAYIVIASFIGMAVNGAASGGASPIFDLLGIATGITALIWLWRKV